MFDLKSWLKATKIQVSDYGIKQVIEARGLLTKVDYGGRNVYGIWNDVWRILKDADFATITKVTAYCSVVAQYYNVEVGTYLANEVNSLFKSYGYTELPGKIENYLLENKENFKRDLGVSERLKKSTAPLEPLGDTDVSTEQQTDGENNMNRLDKYKEFTVAQVTLVNGVDASTMSEHDFFRKLRELQAEQKELESLPASNYVAARIDEVKTDIAAIVTLMDTVLQRSEA